MKSSTVALCSTSLLNALQRLPSSFALRNGRPEGMIPTQPCFQFAKEGEPKREKDEYQSDQKINDPSLAMKLSGQKGWVDTSSQLAQNKYSKPILHDR